MWRQNQHSEIIQNPLVTNNCSWVQRCYLNEASLGSDVDPNPTQIASLDSELKINIARRHSTAKCCYETQLGAFLRQPLLSREIWLNEQQGFQGKHAAGGKGMSQTTPDWKNSSSGWTLVGIQIQGSEASSHSSRRREGKLCRPTVRLTGRGSANDVARSTQLRRKTVDGLKGVEGAWRALWHREQRRFIENEGRLRF